MQIIILGILVIVGCLAYIYVVNNKDNFVSKKHQDAHMYDEPSEEEEAKSSPVIYLPDDIEQEKEKRKRRR